MKNKGTIIQDGVIAGNYYDKYASSNYIARLMVRNFENVIKSSAMTKSPKSVHEIGCGEGKLAAQLSMLPGIESFRATDFSTEVIALAKELYADKGINFIAKSIYELDRNDDSADLIICCEVLEHLDAPRDALECISHLKADMFIFSVPREPLWRALNLFRGKYIFDFGNTPGHIQHWSRRDFVKTLSDFFRIRTIHSTFAPVLAALCTILIIA